MDWRLLFVTAALLIMMSGGALVGQQQSPVLAPDTIYHNGKVITVDTPFTISEAFAVKGDRFVAVGKNAEIRALAGPRTQQVDLRGRAVIPGLMDNHNHQIWRARVLHRGIDMINVPSLAEMLNRIRQAASRAKPGEVIVASGGWIPGRFPEKRGPTKKDLDEAAPNNPVFVFQSGRNNANLNSAALKVLGIDRNTKDWGSFPVLRDDATGEPSGELSGGEQVLTADWKMLPQPSTDQQIQWLMEQQQEQHALGLTGIRDLVLPVEYMRVYQEMHRQGKLTMRVSMGLMFGAQHVDGWVPVQMDQMLSNFPGFPGLGDDTLQLDATLAEFEVTTQRVSTWNRKPYPANSTNIGLSIARWPHSDLMQVVKDAQGNFYGIHRLPTAMFIDLVKKMNRYGYRPGFHISGDAALDWHLDAYEAADRDRSIKGKRWAAEHNGGEYPEQTERLIKLDMVLSLQRQLGPLRRQLDSGLKVSLGSDWPAFSNNPFDVMALHITRKNAQGNVVDPSQKIARAEALRMATINNAYMTFKEKKTGSIEAGKLADFLILDADIMTMPEDQIKSILVLATYVGGKKLFARQGGGF